MLRQLWKIQLVISLSIILATASVLTPTWVQAQVETPRLLKDINTQPISISEFSDLVAVDKALFFTARDSSHGRELWKIDNSAQEATLVKDIAPGVHDGFAKGGIKAIHFHHALYFAADDGVHGQELWKSDGTDAGTVMVKDIITGSPGSFFEAITFIPGGPPIPPQFTIVDDTLYFIAYDNYGRWALWKSDGSTEGTVKVKDALYFRTPPTMLAVGNSVFFTLANRLWKSDGTTDGTIEVADLGSVHLGGTCYDTAIIRSLTSTSDMVYFEAISSLAIGFELWKSDGTSAGTSMVKDINPVGNSFPAQMVGLGGLLYFSATDGEHGIELWRSDGTVEGTFLIQDLYSGSGSAAPYSLTNLANTLYFVADDGVHGSELWKLDQTTGSPVLLKDINQTTSSAQISSLTVISNTFYFTADDGIHGLELWQSDGTTDGTLPQHEFISGTLPSAAYALTRVDDALYLVGSNSIYRLNLLTNEAQAIKITALEAYTSSSGPAMLGQIGDFILFTTDDGIHGRELWKSDGTMLGTTIVKDIRLGQESSFPSAAYQFNDMLYFAADDGIHGRELWVSDGTSAGTILVQDLNPEAEASNPTVFLSYNGKLLFFASSIPSNIEDLWISDGTSVGTALVSKNALVGSVVAFNGLLYFAAGEQGVNEIDLELWKSDGTATGTGLVKDLNPGPAGSWAGQFLPVGTTLYFTVYDAEHGEELWQSQGAADNTTLVKDILPGPPGSEPRTLHNLNEKLLFVAFTDETGTELWQSDGSTTGTVLVKDIYTGTLSSQPHDFHNLNNIMLFFATDGENHMGLWQSDGTASGTRLIREFLPDSPIQHFDSRSNPLPNTSFCLTNQPSVPTQPDEQNAVAISRLHDAMTLMPSVDQHLSIELHGMLYFVADDGVSGTELWASDGTTEGTRLIKDIHPGSGGSAPTILSVVDDKFYFAADDGLNGRTLWVSDGSANGTVGLFTWSDSQILSFIKDKLLFSHRDQFTGAELWAWEPARVEIYLPTILH